MTAWLECPLEVESSQAGPCYNARTLGQCWRQVWQVFVPAAHSTDGCNHDALGRGAAGWQHRANLCGAGSEQHLT
jgi:hypothetical protein